MKLLFLRHGPTKWNIERKLQGRADIPLSEEGERQVLRWRLPAEWLHAPCFCSPLSRATETARLLGLDACRIEARLIEMHWGEFEGYSIGTLRDQDPAGMAENEARGLDFGPPGGETPREVRARVEALILALNEEERVIFVSHKGVRRALISYLTGWDMTRRIPIRVHGNQALLCDIPNSDPPSLSALELLQDSNT